MLKDKYNRSIKYLRISLTESCNLNCFYCRRSKNDSSFYPRKYLNSDELLFIAGAFAELGVSHIRLSGGEPLLRKDLCEITNKIRYLPGVNDLSLTTNALLLEKMARSLKRAGLNRVNISLDALAPSTFNKITGGSDLKRVLKGIDAAVAEGLTPIKINMVVIKGINDDELIPMIEFCMEKKVILRLIEFMPIGKAALSMKKHFMPVDEIRERISRKFPLEKTTLRGPGPAWYEYVKGDGLMIGFISAVSRHFCETCNRIRLTANGMLHLCLGHENRVDLAEVVRTPGVSIEDLKNVIRKAVWNKPKIHCFDKNGSTANRQEMSAIGG